MATYAQSEAFAKGVQGRTRSTASSSGTSFDDLKGAQRSNATFSDEEAPGAGTSQNRMSA